MASIYSVAGGSRARLESCAKLKLAALPPVRGSPSAGGWLVVDLGVAIGSLRWFRGLITCGALCLGAGSFTPSLSPLLGFCTPAYTPAQENEASAQAIAPLAFGSGTGRRMASNSAVQVLTRAPDRREVSLNVTFDKGDGLGSLLTRSGLGVAEVGEVVALVSDAVNPADLAPGTAINMTLGRPHSHSAVRPLEQLDFRARFDLKLVVKRVAGALTLVREPIAVDETPLRIQGRAGSGLYLAALAAGAPSVAVEAYIRTLNQRVPIGSVDAEDRFDLIVARRRAATGESQIGDLLYVGLHRRRQDISMMRWIENGKAQWFDGSGIADEPGQIHAPVDSSRITSNFGMRMHPLLGYTRMHKGLDIGAPYGAPIMATMDGIVRFAGWHGGHGNYVLLKHGDNLMTGYAHMSRILAQPGSYVSAGQVIGYVGSTGLTTGPHLHYEVYRDNVAINPSSLQLSSVVRLAGGDLARFKAAFAGLLAVRARNEMRQAQAVFAGKSARG